MSSPFENARPTRDVAAAASVVSGGTLVSRVLGYIRDMLIARAFGGGATADAFFVAFRIPNMARELLGEGALSAAFIPVFTETLAKRGRPAAVQMAARAFWAVALILVVVCMLGIWAAPILVRLIAPGFGDEPEKLQLTITLTRMMVPYLFFIGLTALMMGTLNSLGHFAAPALSPALLNIAMILSLLWIAPQLDEPITALAYGVLAGGVLQLLSQLPPATSRGVTLTRPGGWKDPALARIGRLMAPGVAGLAITQLNVFITTLLASFLVEGSVSHLYYAFRLVHLPIGLIGVALATAVFPAMAAAVQRSPNDLKATLLFALRLSLFLTMPALLGLVIFRHSFILLLFERGAFTRLTTLATAQALLGYCLGLGFFVANRVLVPAFHAFQDTVTPVKAGAIAVASNIAFSLVLMGPLQAAGLALATSLASAVNFSLLTRLLRRHLGPLPWQSLATPLKKTALAGLCMAGTLLLFEAVLPPIEGQAVSLGLVRVAAELGAGTAVFWGAAALLGCEEVHVVRGFFRKAAS